MDKTTEDQRIPLCLGDTKCTKIQECRHARRCIVVSLRQAGYWQESSKTALERVIKSFLILPEHGG